MSKTMEEPKTTSGSIDLPVELMAIADIAARESTRYAFSDTFIQKRAGKSSRVCATDGRMVIIAEFGKAVDVDSSVQVKLRHEVLDAMCASRPSSEPIKIDYKQDDDQVIVSRNGAMLSLDLGVGKFPPIDDVIPKFKTYVNDDGDSAVRFGVSGSLLRKLLLAISKCAPRNIEEVILEIPTQRNKPMKIISRGEDNGVRVVGALMPTKNIDAELDW